MSLQYKTEVYIRKAIRQAVLVETEAGGWIASLPVFGLGTSGETRDEAEQNLLIRLTMCVLSAPHLGWVLPAIEGIDLTTEFGASQEAETLLLLDPRESEMVAQALATPPPPTEYMRQAAREYQDFMSR